MTGGFKMIASYTSNLCLDPLRDPSSSSSLKTLNYLVGTCVGPHGKLKLIQNSSGSSVSMTSSCQRLFHHISIRNVFSKIIISAVKSHLKTDNDGGLMCAVTIIKLIFNSLSLDYSLPLVGALYDNFGRLYIECLESKNNLSVFDVDFSTLCHLRSVVTSLLSSKPGCSLVSEDKSYICSLLLEAFLNVIPSTSNVLNDFNTRILISEGTSVKHSKLYNGVLLDICKSNLKVIIPPGSVKVIIFTASLSGDVELTVHKLDVVSSNLASEVVMKYLSDIVEKMIAAQVNVVFCQKVIHPRLRKELHDAGIVVFDRLGSEAIKYIQLISGGLVNSSLSAELFYGSLSSIRIEVIGQNSFLLLRNESVPFFSLVICNYNMEAASELKVVCHQVMNMLFRVIKNPKLCFGAGCIEIYTAHLLVKKVKETVDAIKQEFGCTNFQVQSVLKSFLLSIADLAVTIHQGVLSDFVTESMYGHLWRLQNGGYPTGHLRCQCGRYTASDLKTSFWNPLHEIENSFADLCFESSGDNSGVLDLLILDELSCKINSFSVAFETASLLLRTSICINNLPHL